MPDWIYRHEVALHWIVAASAISFVATLIIVPWLIVRIPQNYFASKQQRTKPPSYRHPLAHALLLVDLPRKYAFERWIVRYCQMLWMGI